MPPGLAQALGPVLEQIAGMTAKIKLYDRQIQELGQTKYLWLAKIESGLKLGGIF
jgi:hypothetical protein